MDIAELLIAIFNARLVVAGKSLDVPVDDAGVEHALKAALPGPEAEETLIGRSRLNAVVNRISRAIESSPAVWREAVHRMFAERLQWLQYAAGRGTLIDGVTCSVKPGLSRPRYRHAPQFLA